MQKILIGAVSLNVNSGCGVTLYGEQNSISVLNQPSSQAYTASVWASQPSFQSQSIGGISLSSYLDPACLSPSSGVLSAPRTALNVASNLALFQNVSYASPTHTEETIYLKAVNSAGISVCTSGSQILQHFVPGTGYLLGPSPGVAGASGSSEYDFIWNQLIDRKDRVVTVSRSTSASGAVKFVLSRLLADGSPDTSFAGTGTFTTGTSTAVGGTGSNLFEQAIDVKIDLQDRLIVSGISRNSAGGFEGVIWRYLDNGTLDSSFGSAGIVTTGAVGIAGATGANVDDEFTVLRIDSLNRIVVVGQSVNASGGVEVAIWRYLANGTLDSTFGTAGVMLSGATGFTGATGANEYDYADAFAFDSQERLVVAVESTNSAGGGEIILLRYLTTGILDSSFGTSGAVHYGSTGVAGATGAYQDDTITSFRITDSGQLIVVGGSAYAQNKYKIFIGRFQSNGAIDTSFGSAGFLVTGTTSLSGATASSIQESGNDIEIDKNGSYVVNGTFSNRMVILRYFPTGTLDTTFATNGYYLGGTTSFAGGSRDATNRLVIDSAGRYLVTGTSVNAASGTQSIIWRFKPNGTLDL